MNPTYGYELGGGSSAKARGDDRRAENVYYYLTVMKRSPTYNRPCPRARNVEEGINMRGMSSA